MRSRIVLFILGYCVWILLNWLPDWQHLFIGIFVSGLVVFLTENLFPGKNGTDTIFSEAGDKKIVSVPIFFDIKRYLWALYYIPVFLLECVKANIDVAYRVMHPDLPIRPGIVKIKTALKSDIALTFLANTITLTPGTMSVDIDKKKGVLYIHWINVKDDGLDEATKHIVGKFETILRGIFE